LSADDFLRRLREALERTGIPYMLAGSFASSVHGMPRATQDIDLVIDPTPEQLAALLSQFPAEEYYVSPEAAEEALAQRSQFNVIDFTSGWKVDFIIRKLREFSQLEFVRRTPLTLLGLTLHVATAEDTIIAKLEWANRSASERQLEDVAGILRRQGEQLDLPYLERWVDQLGLQAEWDRARAKAT
jgi:hypothetical protein